MAIQRYIASQDTTITNAFKENLQMRATGSNTGAADVLEMFSIYGQVSGSTGLTVEQSRIIMQFPVTEISDDRTSGTIPQSGSVNFVLKVANAEHHETTPQDYTAAILAVSESWAEGSGLDLDQYRDTDAANWDLRNSSTGWGNGSAAANGGVYHTGSVENYSSEIQFAATFGEATTENLEVDITPLVEHWIAGTVTNCGIGIMLSGTYEDGTNLRSYYTKKFFARGSEFFYKRPTIEARWDSAKTDDRANFYASSSLVSTENSNTLFLYNYARGQLTNIPGLLDNKIGVKIYRDALTDDAPETVHGGICPLSSTGVYTASIAIDTSASVLYDVWYTGSTEYFTGTVSTVNNFTALTDNPNQTYTTTLTSLKPAYSTKETARFRFFTRKQNWSPTIYTKATETLNSDIVESAYYKVFRVNDNYEVIPYGTGSTLHTKMSYDQSGSYFDLDMSMLQKNYAYGLSVAYYLNGKYVEQSEVFKFRVEE